MILVMNNHRILYGDVWACLSTLEDNSIDCAITSPPYWSQRDYGFDNQIGNEELLNDYLEKLITIFNLLKTKLKPSGVFYLNIGDKYQTKYGNTPLGMIPYLLVYYLVSEGEWNLDDVQIWYKINHMPSSVKNRFTNSYEPIFVLVKAKTNYYTIYKQKNKTNNILKIPLQPVPYKHMATFPEKLVEALLKQGIPNKAIILDPFAGSGTTCKAAQNLSEGYFNPIKFNSIMIESFKEYIKIIKTRCKINKKNIKKIPFVPFTPIRLNPNFDVPVQISDKESETPFEIKLESNIIRIFTETEEFDTFIPYLFTNTLYELLDDDGLLFLGLPDHDIDKLFTMAQLNQYGWVIRNMIIVPRNNDWFPIFMLVKDIKSVKYKFNLDEARIAHKLEQSSNWDKMNFVGYRVEKSQSYYKKPESGMIAEIISKYPNGLPNWVLVKWNRSKIESFEEIIDSSIHSNQINVYCPSCDHRLVFFHHYKDKVSCENCNLQLWEGIASIPRLKENKIRIEPNYKYTNQSIPRIETKKSNYRGKFKDAKKINLGQSPGARASVNEQFFTMQRYYKVKQSMISDYLNIHRKKVKLTKKELTEKFPSEYKHTCGHWLRKDMGGSLPKIEDLRKLQEILVLDEAFVNYISRMGLKLQTVIADEKGKNPGDFLEYPVEKVLEILKSVSD